MCEHNDLISHIFSYFRIVSHVPTYMKEERLSCGLLEALK